MTDIVGWMQSMPYRLSSLIWRKKDRETFCPSAEFGVVSADGPPTSIWGDATLVTSRHTCMTKHWPVLDLDMPCILLDSSTPGHHHLIIQQDIQWSKYLPLLKALYEAGIIEEGYYHASRKRGYSAIRRPGVLKGEE